MSRRIVSWRINEPRVSPVEPSSSTVSVISINSIVSDTHMMTTETPGVQPAELGAKLTNFPGSANPTSDDSFVPHHTYSFKDGNITFLVDGILYCVHRYFFSRDSVYFSTKFDLLDVRDHEPLSTTISLGDVERKDFEAFLSVMYPINFEKHDLSYEQWKSVLHLSTRWGFATLRNLALNSIKPPTPFYELLLARTYNVDRWVLPALSALCTRTTPITLKEARQMSTEDVVLVATVREEICSLGTFVDMAEIERRIEATQIDMVFDEASDAAEKEPPKEAVTGTGVQAHNYNDIKKVAASKSVDMQGSDGHPLGIAEVPLAKFSIPDNKRAGKKPNKRKAEHVPDTLSKEGGLYPVSPGSVFGQHHPVSGQPAMGVPAMGSPGIPMARPDTPETRPGTPITRPGTPGTRPGTPITRPGTPETRPSTPVGKPFGTPKGTPINKPTPMASPAMDFVKRLDPVLAGRTRTRKPANKA